MRGGAAAAALAAVIALAGCGGDDSDDGDADVRQTVRDFVTATNERDGDTLCGELLTQEYLEKATGATGDQAEEACKEQLDLVTGLKLRLISVGRAKVDGDRASVRAVIVAAGQRGPRVFSLAKEDGRWKLVGGSAG